MIYDGLKKQKNNHLKSNRIEFPQTQLPTSSPESSAFDSGRQLDLT